jgi:hypothetical protein
MYALSVPLRRRLAYIAASLIAAAGMISGHAIAGAAANDGGSSAAQWIGVLSWVAAGIAAVLIDRSVPARAAGFASLALPLVWFGMLLVSEEHTLWMLGLVAMAVFGLIAGLSAGAMKLLFRVIARRT